MLNESTEARLYAALETVMQADHLAMDGEPGEAAVYRFARQDGIWESDVPIMLLDVYEVRVYQRDFDERRVWEVRDALREAGFQVTARGAEAMENGYYRFLLEVSAEAEER